MSTLVMSKCWPLQLPPTQKAVLISLADNANDHGECWPSIPTICERTCFSERAVHRAIQELEKVGALVSDRSNGRHTRYVVTPANLAVPPQMRHPRISDTPADAAIEPPQMRQSPPQMRQSPPQQVRSNRKEPSRTVSKATVNKKRADALTRPDGVDEQTWFDWLDLRKAKKAPVTETVLTHAIRESEKAGMTLDAFLRIWCFRGSQGLEAAWLKPHERAGPQSGKPSAAENFQGKTYASTPIDQLPPDLRDAARAAIADG
ncbi:helix-turn-helix domain-containing protein [Pseudoxanthomonas dokdonensis]|uniref:helix-turn-helix domain-containing protein n=1 Tax=Pseudoxanthomonas dokdonensis TaxID=344882 RepID=UPI0012EEA510|nr:helix-turn-helix domain-containing protein [Pseudoxanthomonas dokdonensis]